MKKRSTIVVFICAFLLISCLLNWEGPDLTSRLAKAYYVKYSITDPTTAKTVSSEELPPTSFARIKRVDNYTISLTFNIKDGLVFLGNGYHLYVFNEDIHPDSLRKQGYKEKLILSTLHAPEPRLGTLYVHLDNKITGKVRYTDADGRIVSIYIRE